jgi:hypothetical protein
MRRTLVLSTLGALCFASTAHAQIVEPNGLHVPIDSTPEVQLYTLFTQRSETINWQTDAHTAPSTFSPLCGFTATFVLNQAGSHFGLAWYNATGSRPPASGLHQLLAAGAAVGTTINSANIRMDPAYTGGLIGFALIGGETHYTESQWDNVCTSCTPNAPWITALMYRSTQTPNAYYVCFEDGGTSATGWNNDGDFNDDVFFVTGVTCSGGGAMCDTGMMGVCANGVQQCTSGGTLSCVPVVSASTEVCNGVDDDCDGMVDEGNGICTMAGFLCDHGTCVHPCDAGEFRCATGLTCNAAGFCVDPLCANTMCTAGTVCHAGTCRAPCDGVTCPHGTVCRVDRCVDPCMGVTCSGGQVCDAGVCRDSCTCQPCATGLTCDMTSGRCGDPACATVTCNAGQFCSGGTCMDGCTGVTCPPAQLCMAGACVADPCATMTCMPGLVCRAGACVDPCMGVTCMGGQRCMNGTCVNDPCASTTCPTTAHCVGGVCVPNGDGGAAVDGSHVDAGPGHDAGGGHPPMVSGGCCSVAGATPIRGLVLGLIGLALVIARRSARRSL